MLNYSFEWAVTFNWITLMQFKFKIFQHIYVLWDFDICRNCLKWPLAWEIILCFRFSSFGLIRSGVDKLISEVYTFYYIGISPFPNMFCVSHVSKLHVCMSIIMFSIPLLWNSLYSNTLPAAYGDPLLTLSI